MRLKFIMISIWCKKVLVKFAGVLVEHVMYIVKCLAKMVSVLRSTFEFSLGIPMIDIIVK